MRFENESLNVTFEIPEPVKVRSMLRWDTFIESLSLDMYDRLWRGVCAIARNWESEHVPELDPDLLDLLALPDDRLAYETIKWACLGAFSFMNALKEVPPN